MIFKHKATSGRPAAFASILYAEPGALGLTANILSAVTVAIGNIVDDSDNKIPLIISGKLKLRRLIYFIFPIRNRIKVHNYIFLRRNKHNYIGFA
jgi:hypothetical protein